MFRAIIVPIFRSTRLCVTACGIMHPYTTSCNTQSSAPEDGKNNCPKHVELTGIINKPSRLSILFIFQYIFLRLAKQSQFIPPQNVVYFITLPVLIRKIFTFYINDVLLFKCPFPGPNGYSDLLNFDKASHGTPQPEYPFERQEEITKQLSQNSQSRDRGNTKHVRKNSRSRDRGKQETL